MKIQRKALITLTFALPILGWLMLGLTASLPAWTVLTIGAVVLCPLLWALAWFWERPTAAEKHLLATLRRKRPTTLQDHRRLYPESYQGSALATMYRYANATSDPLSGSSVPTTGTTPRPSERSGVSREQGPTA